MKIQNTKEGQKPLSLKIKVMYQHQNGTKVDETKVLNSLPTNYYWGGGENQQSEMEIRAWK